MTVLLLLVQNESICWYALYMASRESCVSTDLLCYILYEKIHKHDPNKIQLKIVWMRYVFILYVYAVYQLATGTRVRNEPFYRRSRVNLFQNEWHGLCKQIMSTSVECALFNNKWASQKRGTALYVLNTLSRINNM